jgi:predicted Zn-dependent protease
VTPLQAPEITPVEQTPVQTYQRPEAAAPREPAAAAESAAGERETVAMATPPRSMSKAVKTLLQQAELQRSSDDLTGAAATLERALRIEPDSAYVWNRLAHVRAEQGQAGLAGELAAKSNAFAGGDETLKRDNDKLIARSRSR